MKIPEWFREWLENDYKHLEQNVVLIKRDVKWIKWLVGFTLLALIAAAVATLFVG